MDPARSGDQFALDIVKIGALELDVDAFLRHCLKTSTIQFKKRVNIELLEPCDLSRSIRLEKLFIMGLPKSNIDQNNSIVTMGQ